MGWQEKLRLTIKVDNVESLRYFDDRTNGIRLDLDAIKERIDNECIWYTDMKKFDQLNNNNETIIVLTDEPIILMDELDKCPDELYDAMIDLASQEGPPTPKMVPMGYNFGRPGIGKSIDANGVFSHGTPSQGDMIRQICEQQGLEVVELPLSIDDDIRSEIHPMNATKKIAAPQYLNGEGSNCSCCGTFSFMAPANSVDGKSFTCYTCRNP